MALFASVWVNKVDRKGRVSIPAAFRNDLARQDAHDGNDSSEQGLGRIRVAVYPTTDGTPAVECCGIDRLEELGARLSQAANPFSPTLASARMAFFSQVEIVLLDGDGRISLTDKLIERTRIADRAKFVGLGETFQIWEPATFDAAWASVKERGLRDLIGLELPPAPGGRE